LLAASSMPASTEINERNVGTSSASCFMIQAAVNLTIDLDPSTKSLKMP